MSKPSPFHPGDKRRAHDIKLVLLSHARNVYPKSAEEAAETRQIWIHLHYNVPLALVEQKLAKAGYIIVWKRQCTVSYTWTLLAQEEERNSHV